MPQINIEYNIRRSKHPLVETCFHAALRACEVQAALPLSVAEKPTSACWFNGKLCASEVTLVRCSYVYHALHSYFDRDMWRCPTSQSTSTSRCHTVQFCLACKSPSVSCHCFHGDTGGGFESLWLGQSLEERSHAQNLIRYQVCFIPLPA